MISGQIVKEITNRLSFLEKVDWIIYPWLEALAPCPVERGPEN